MSVVLGSLYACADLANTFIVSTYREEVLDDDEI